MQGLIHLMLKTEIIVILKRVVYHLIMYSDNQKTLEYEIDF